MEKERDEDSGKFVKQYPKEDFLTAIENLNTATTQKVADEVGCSYDLAYRRLNELAEEEAISAVEVGGSLMWSLE